MVPVTLNEMVSTMPVSALACVIACRSEPVPESAVVLTRMAVGVSRSSKDSRRGRKRKRWKRGAEQSVLVGRILRKNDILETPEIGTRTSAEQSLKDRASKGKRRPRW